MSTALESALVSTEWLAKHLDAPDVCVVDATWFLDKSKGDPKAMYEEEHIPGAVFFDIDDICDDASDLPHMLPSPEKFSSRVRKLGLGDGNRIVVYDANGGAMAAARVWWMFRVFGHEDVVVLDGGLPKWKDEGRQISDMPPVPRQRHFTCRFNNMIYRDVDHMLRNVETGRDQVVDARAAERFSGTADEPHPVQKKGHIPGAKNIPFPTFLNADKTFKAADDIRQAAADAGLDLSKPIAASCGSGVTACVLALGLFQAGVKDVAVYDGSWAEWGNHADTPVEN